MDKRCKQCLEILPDDDDNFRPYVPRGKGLRRTTVGRNTVCRNCERLNNTTSRLWKMSNRTAEEEKLLANSAEYYKMLKQRGGEPIGAYARHVLGLETPAKGRGASAVEELLALTEVAVMSRDTLYTEYDALLALPLTDEPDVYQEMLDELMQRSLGPDGRVAAVYRPKYEKVATRFDDYEDEYWKDDKSKERPR